MTFLDEIFL